jgi:ubiquinone/menaquinone biosynthesis C-methylase UbiE
MLTGAEASTSTGAVETAKSWLSAGLHDRAVSVGYGIVYDYIFDLFRPYQRLREEVVSLLEASVPPSADRREVRVLDIGCGPGNFTFTLAEAGFSVVGIDPYDAVIELGREKRRARRLTNLAFRRADLAAGNTFADSTFDHVVSIHSLYAHPSPDELLREACRVLKPGGHAVFVNHTRRGGVWSALRVVQAQEGLAAAFRSLLWVVPNWVFEATRRRSGPHYWHEAEFAAHLRNAGFTVLEMRRTFFNDASLLVSARKDTEE